MWTYIGRGSYLPGIPARDLTNDEAKQYGEDLLKASGLYSPPAKSSGSMKPKPSENKADIPESEDK